MIDSFRGKISIFLGLIVFAFGLLPFLNHIGLIGFELPNLLGGIIFPILLIVGSILLFMGSLHQDMIRKPMMFVGFVILVLGIIPLLAFFNVIPQDYTMTFLRGIFRDIVLMVTGIFLMLGSGD